MQWQVANCMGQHHTCTVGSIYITNANNRLALTGKGLDRLTDSPIMGMTWHHTLRWSDTGWFRNCIACCLDTAWPQWWMHKSNSAQWCFCMVISHFSKMLHFGLYASFTAGHVVIKLPYIDLLPQTQLREDTSCSLFAEVLLRLKGSPAGFVWHDTSSWIAVWPSSRRYYVVTLRQHRGPCTVCFLHSMAVIAQSDSGKVLLGCWQGVNAYIKVVTACCFGTKLLFWGVCTLLQAGHCFDINAVPLKLCCQCDMGLWCSCCPVMPDGSRMAINML